MDISLRRAIPLISDQPATVTREGALLAIEADSSNFSKFPQFNTDPEFAKAAFCLNGESYAYASIKLRDNKKLLKIALKSYPAAHYHASRRLLFCYKFGMASKHPLSKFLINIIENCPPLLESAIYVAKKRPDLIPYLPVEFRDRLEIIVLQEDLTGTRIEERFNWIATCKKMEFAYHGR